MSVIEISTFHLRRQCNKPAVQQACAGDPVPACAAQPAPAARRAERVARGGRPARRPTELTCRWRVGAAEGHFQGGHGRETGRRWRVGSREKWLYFSYTPVKCDNEPHPWGCSGPAHKGASGGALLSSQRQMPLEFLFVRALQLLNTLRTLPR
jgi:hypothetical protein